LMRAMLNHVEITQQGFGQYTHRLAAQTPNRQIKYHVERSRALSRRLIRAQNQQLHNTGKRLASLGDQLQLVSPLATLGRGFSIARDEQANILRDATRLKPADKIDVQLQSGSVECEVLRIKQ
ncbi:MAG: hypothetical protein KJP04_06140, partial [Arenicella sp.]|nr:hypothetical protein [Arenicella sp.]